MMTLDDKVDMVMGMLGDDAPDAGTVETYLNAAKREILGWRYPQGSAPEEVPDEYEMTQVQAVVNGFTQRGNEGQSVSIENGIHRHFEFSDMVRYIRGNVIAFARVPGAVSAP